MAIQCDRQVSVELRRRGPLPQVSFKLNINLSVK
jgi:hypothetical protein